MVAVDVWSAGIMLLSLLTHKFPVFNSSDDIEALMEITAIFGRNAMEKCAMLHSMFLSVV
jgi:cell division control protein 7